MRITITGNQLAAALAAFRAALADALEDITEDALRESNLVVPLDEGPLERSGFAQVDRANLTGQVAYDTPYAIRQHEDPTLRHAAGRKAKFLEDAVEENRARYVKYLQDAAQRATGG